MNIVAITQARMGSTRFPNKMLMELCRKPLIAWTVERLRQSTQTDSVVIATSEAPRDDVLANWCQAHNVSVFRGSEDDVLDRFYQCARSVHATHIVRVTGDCPLIDPGLVDRVIDLCIDSSDVEYATNGEPLTYPEGMTVEVLTFKTLETAWRESTLPSHREHVTPFVRFHPERFSHATIQANLDLSHIRLTVDYESDMIGLTQLIQALQIVKPEGNFTLEEIVRVLEERSDIAQLLESQQRDLWRQSVAQEEQQKA